VRLLNAVAERLEERAISYCVIGAAALAVHGVSRATSDVDLFTVRSEVLLKAIWEPPLRHPRPVTIDLRRGDPDDPLAGVVRFGAVGEADIDLVVGRSAWQGRVISRARPSPFPERSLPVATAADLVLLKLYAGGSQDAWDIAQLLIGADPVLLLTIEERLSELPADGQRLWRRIRSGD
jgi:hypothetical protein